jgi:hypothetical protein
MNTTPAPRESYPDTMSGVYALLADCTDKETLRAMDTLRQANWRWIRDPQVEGSGASSIRWTRTSPPWSCTATMPTSRWIPPACTGRPCARTRNELH